MPARKITRTRRSIAVAATALGVVTLGAAAASAHVTVSPDTAAADSYATLTFKVPNESADATTTKLRVDLPTDAPFTSVSVEPVPGWTAKVTSSDLPEPVDVHGTQVTEAPSAIVWTADDDDAAIDAGEFQRFTISAGAVPADADTLTLPATQTYSDGEVVKWDDEASDDGTEPEHPAPTIEVTPADEDGHHAATGSGDAEGSTGEEDAGDEAQEDSSRLAILLGSVGTGLGLVGAATGVVALVLVGRKEER